MSDWRELNRANWDERVAVHLGSAEYDLGPLRAGHGRLNAIEEAELDPVAGLRVLHLQCHFGRDSLALTQRGAEITGLDFSGLAVGAARALAAELGLSARFVQADLYDAPEAIPEPGSFDLVFTTWGTIGWLPDMVRWARVVAHFLRPGGALYFADAHPAALVFDDMAGVDAGGRPGWFAPYFAGEPLVIDDPTDYADPNAHLANQRQVNWLHRLGDILGALRDAGLRLEWLHEHPRVTWRMFRCLVRTDGGGVSDHVFALAHLLGFRFAPRIPNLADRKLYAFGSASTWPALAPFIAGRPDDKLIAAQWDDVLRMTASVRTGTVSASLLLKRLGAYPRQNGLALALREIGRIERTLHALDWLERPALRRQATAELNKGESRNALTRAVCFHRLGRLHDRTAQAQQHRASGLALVTAAIALWNTVYLGRALDAARRNSNLIPDALLAHLAPLGWQHLNLTGDYLWGADAGLGPDGFRPLRGMIASRSTAVAA